MKYWLALLCLFFLGCDFLSKEWAVNHLPLIHWSEGYPFHGIGMFQLGPFTFSLNFVTNTGAAWGLFAGKAGLLFGIRIAIICALVSFLALFNKGKNPLFPMGLILTGAIGNALDYWRYGYVIDFLHFTFWGSSFPVFNLADSYITVGAILLFFFSTSKKSRLFGVNRP